jgi:UPF0271 protein
MGESHGNVIIGNDEAIFPYITSCNIACGFHGGDPIHMERTIRLALQHGVQIGAHPSYPDRDGFGRRKMHLSREDLKAVLVYQISALCGMTASLGGVVRYVKPHGALYNIAADEEAEARTVIEALIACDSNLALMGLPDSAMEYSARQEGIQFIREAFADRRYDSNGKLVPRSAHNAVIDDPSEAAQQVLLLVQEQKVVARDGQTISVHADSICVHGDHKNTLDILIAIDVHFRRYGIAKKSVPIVVIGH